MRKEELVELRQELETPRKWPIVLLDEDNHQYSKLWDRLLEENDEGSSNLG